MPDAARTAPPCSRLRQATGLRRRVRRLAARSCAPLGKQARTQHRSRPAGHTRRPRESRAHHRAAKLPSIRPVVGGSTRCLRPTVRARGGSRGWVSPLGTDGNTPRPFGAPSRCRPRRSSPRPTSRPQLGAPSVSPAPAPPGDWPLLGRRRPPLPPPRWPRGPPRCRTPRDQPARDAIPTRSGRRTPNRRTREAPPPPAATGAPRAAARPRSRLPHRRGRTTRTVPAEMHTSAGPRGPPRGRTPETSSRRGHSSTRAPATPASGPSHRDLASGTALPDHRGQTIPGAAPLRWSTRNAGPIRRSTRSPGPATARWPGRTTPARACSDTSSRRSAPGPRPTPRCSSTTSARTPDGGEPAPMPPEFLPAAAPPAGNAWHSPPRESATSAPRPR